MSAWVVVIRLNEPNAGIGDLQSQINRTKPFGPYFTYTKHIPEYLSAGVLADESRNDPKNEEINLFDRIAAVCIATALSTTTLHAA